MGSILLFAVATYGLTFLIADATIFGASATSWNAHLKNPRAEGSAQLREGEELFAEGILRIRQYFLQFGFFQKLLGCYFCLGVWTGIVMHWVLIALGYANTNWRNSYLLWGEVSPESGVLGSFVAACAGGSVCFAIDRALAYLETRTEASLQLFGD
jgi:hypothetical protein